MIIDQTKIYDLVLSVKDKVMAVDAKVDSVDAKVDSLVEGKKDHETRLRVLEQRKTIAPWQLWTAVGSGVTVFGGLVAALRGLGVG
ncbi:hypothetical protein [Oerskovia enterophila]|uniref:hypothetical protein n=1 Tax=Oerskovia enterophila TaxID=43678 RepID=UPI003830E6A6